MFSTRWFFGKHLRYEKPFTWLGCLTAKQEFISYLFEFDFYHFEFVEKSKYRLQFHSLQVDIHKVPFEDDWPRSWPKTRSLAWHCLRSFSRNPSMIHHCWWLLHLPSRVSKLQWLSDSFFFGWCTSAIVLWNLRAFFSGLCKTWFVPIMSAHWPSVPG